MLIELADKLIRLRTRLSPAMMGGQPRLVRETYDRYDRLRGYKKYLEFCRSRLDRPLPQENTDLHEKGLEIVRIFTPEEARDVMQKAYSLSTGFTSRRNAGNRLYFEIKDERFYLQVLERIFSDEIDARIVRYFGSEYVPFWYVMQESRPGSRPSNSFLWHCDRGPQRWLKILLYFTPTRDTGGATVVLDKEESELVAKAGYTFCKTRDRTSDIRDLENRIGHPLHIMTPELDAGEGILFEPSQIMHRGLIPDKAPRVIMQVQILPSPIHWRKALQRLQQAVMPERDELAFPTHASRLKKILA